AGLSEPCAPAMRRVESPAGGSTLITSAPMSHSCMAQNGPAITCVTSSTRTPASAPPGAVESVRSGIYLESPVSTPHMLFDVDGQIARLTINRPDARNAMTWTMYEALVEACDEVDRLDDVRVFIVRAAGDKAFVSGTDISQFTQFDTPDAPLAYER